MQLARRKRDWPTFPLPSNRGEINAEDVLAVPAGEARDAAISQWCRSVWETFADSRDTVASLLREHHVL
jgi:hypothetical protein